MTNQSKAELQDQFPGKSLSTFLKLLLQVRAKSVNNHEAIPAGTEDVLKLKTTQLEVIYTHSVQQNHSAANTVIFMYTCKLTSDEKGDKPSTCSGGEWGTEPSFPKDLVILTCKFSILACSKKKIEEKTKCFR